MRSALLTVVATAVVSTASASDVEMPATIWVPSVKSMKSLAEEGYEVRAAITNTSFILQKGGSIYRCLEGLVGRDYQTRETKIVQPHCDELVQPRPRS